ncbi:MAG: histidine--tRNA ligase [Bacillota bacterium]
MKFTAPRGTRDMLPAQSHIWHAVEKEMRRVCAFFGYREIRTPVFEHTELFLRGVGDTTDIVQKEMYTFEDKGHRSITLKPEGTAGVVRSFIENGLYNGPQPTKMYYLTNPVFRYENPQAGRLRQHHQFGVEVFGAPLASADAEIISLALMLFSRLGIGELSLRINSIGCPVCRPAYQQALRGFLKERVAQLCATCKQRFETNPMRILDCKEEGCREHIKGFPVMLEYLCDDCTEHFGALKENLTALGAGFTVDPLIVRGLDYYTKTVFEIVSDAIGSQGTVCGGGRYDELIKECGGPPMPGVGFGMGMERLLMVMENQGVQMSDPYGMQVFIGALGEAAHIRALVLANELRAHGIRAETDHVGRSAKAQFKYMDKTGCRLAVMLGDQELKNGRAEIRDLRGAASEECTLDGLIPAIERMLQQGE